MEQFNSMIPMNDPKGVKQFYNMLDEMIEKKISKIRLCRMEPGKVISVAGNGTLTIQLNGDTSVNISGVLNRTNQTLIANDLIWVIFINNGNNYYALIKI
jgi:hypothetical protein